MKSHGPFEWDEQKERENLAKHGVDFIVAQAAFEDARRLIVPDRIHSDREPRYHCIGRVEGGGVMTVRFTPRGDRLRIIGAGFWRKGRKIYEKANPLHG